MDVEIRSAAPRDAGALADVQVRSWRAAYPGIMPPAALESLNFQDRRAAWRMLLRIPTEDRTLVATAAAEIVGFATVGPPQHPADADPGWAEVISIYVAEPGGGVGRKLLGAAETEMRDSGAANALLWVLDRNERARQFYETAGWQATGATRPHDVAGSNLTVVRYDKALSRDDTAPQVLSRSENHESPHPSADRP